MGHYRLRRHHIWKGEEGLEEEELYTDGPKDDLGMTQLEH